MWKWRRELGLDYRETYAPVASRPTICLLILMSSILDLKMQQVGYMQAFPKAELLDPAFMKIPQGWYVNGSGALKHHENLKFNDTSNYLH